jgi:nicotinamidase-related amidase
MAADGYDPNDPYLNWRTPLPDPPIEPGRAALLIIDMQYADASLDAGIFAEKRARGLTAGLDYYAGRLEAIVPAIQRLQRACRAAGIEVIYSRIQSMSADGRDRGGAHKDLRIFCAPGSREAEILEELAPLPNDLVFSKTSGSSFNGTTLDYVLKNMGIRTLIMTGVMTSGCVESSVRDAKDLGYGVIDVDDACASWTEELHQASLRVVDGVFGVVRGVDWILDRIAISSQVVAPVS